MSGMEHTRRVGRIAGIAILIGFAGCQSASELHGTVTAQPVVSDTVTLETALALASVANPTIALSQEAVNASLAQQTEARALLLPTLDAGMNFNWHNGNLESARGTIVDVERQALYVGAGARAIGAGPVTVPGVRVTAQVADAIYAPRVAEQRVISRRFDAEATTNAVLLDVAVQYLALVGAEARLQALCQSESDIAEVVRLTENFSSTGQGRAADAERARSEANLLHLDVERVEEETAVIAAELSRLLSQDPATRLHSPVGPLPALQMVDPKETLEHLIQIALLNRPEIGARSADVAFQETRLHQEKVRPWVPLVSLGFSAGEFGGGSDLADSRFGHFDGRADVSVLAVWSLQNLGLGNIAVQHRVRAEADQAAAERRRVIDRIRREVAEAYGLMAARRQEIEVAKQRFATAERAFREDLARSRNLLGRPIEVLNSFNLLNAARQDLIRAQVGYDQAQVQLYVALGQAPR